MGEVHMDAEDILAEPDEPSTTILSLVLGFLHTYGWYIIAAAIAGFMYYKNRLSSVTSAGSGGNAPKTAAELQDWQSKEEQRLKAVQRLQEKYAQDAAIRAERQKQLDEEKRKAKLEEMQKLAGKVDIGQKLGEGDDKNKKSFRPEYNPLAGDAGSSGRVCFRRPGGGSGG